MTAPRERDDGAESEHRRHGVGALRDAQRHRRAPVYASNRYATGARDAACNTLAAATLVVGQEQQRVPHVVDAHLHTSTEGAH